MKQFYIDIGGKKVRDDLMNNDQMMDALRLSIGLDRLYTADKRKVKK